jgi:hypothetical protein
VSDEKALEVRKQQVSMTTHGVELTSMDDAWRFCEAIEGTPIAPKGMGAKAIFGVIQSGAEMGLSPLRSLSNMKIINGRVGPMGALAKALVRQANVLEPGTGFKEKFTGTEGEDDWTAHFATHRAGEASMYHTEFSVKDAKQAGLWMKKSRDGKPGPWCQYPKRMLMWRAIGFHMDDYYSDVLMGFHIAEVLPDYPPEREVVVMEPLDEPAKDPLLDDLDAKYTAEVDEIAKELQPDDEPTVITGSPEHPVLEPSVREPVPGPELNTDFNDLEGPDGEPILKIASEDVDPPSNKQAQPISPLSDTMTELEALEGLKAEGEDISDEALAAADPGNAAPEGEEPEDAA